MLILPPEKPFPQVQLPSMSHVALLSKQLLSYIRPTPCIPMWLNEVGCQLWGKMECWQVSGSFKFRGALHSLQQLTEAQRDAGVVTASAGNHALALCYAAQVIPTSVKIIMPKEVDAHRVERCEQLGAEIILADSFCDVFSLLEELSHQQRRAVVHPFEGPLITAATSTIGLEIAEGVNDLDAVVVAVGGGGLISGVSYAIKHQLPHCQVYGVEPTGAATLTESFIAGKPLALNKVNTIAKSLSAPESLPYSFSVCREFVDGLVTVTDNEMLKAMHCLFDEMALAVEPAAACALAAIKGPLQSELQGKKVMMIVCGSNMSFDEMGLYFNPDEIE